MENITCKRKLERTKASKRKQKERVIMKNLSVRIKMIILAVITMIGTLAIVLISQLDISEMESGAENVLRASIESDYDQNI